jgi:hypothetical protein
LQDSEPGTLYGELCQRLRCVGIVATILALAAAFKFTLWYPDRVSSQAVH